MFQEKDTSQLSWDKLDHRNQMVPYIGYWENKYYNLSPSWGFEPHAVCPKKAIPAEWRVSCTPLSACLFRVPRRGAVQIAHTSVSPVWYLGVSSFHFLCFFLFLFFVFWWNENSRYIGLKPGGPDPFQVSAVTTRGQCLYSSRDCNFFFLWHIWHSRSRVFKKSLSVLIK